MSTVSIPILMYHRIGPRASNSIVRDQYVSAKLFESQLRCLSSKGFRSISLDELVMRLRPGGTTELGDGPARPLVAITFDDGYETFYTGALPILKQYGMIATVFLVANCVGLTNRWDEAKGDVSERLMTVEQIDEAHRQGMEFGAHTLSHPDLRFCSEGMAEREITDSKRLLGDLLGFEIRFFSYPYGKHGERDRSLVRRAGYAGACGTSKHPNTSDTDLFDLGRVNVRATTSPPYLLHKLGKVAARDA